ncbi:MAG TPA: hypothetical protein VMK65_04780 [Longimicrobiales bacterium]|nr:hypothetical protein [Longimicrobiales bacterium]
MHTEHLQNVRGGLIMGAWLIAAAVTSLLFLALASTGLLDTEDAESAMAASWTLATVGVGFFVGGFFAGFRALHAPILHGIGIGIASLVAWLGLNLLAILFDGAGWEGLPPLLTATLLLEQMLFAVLGAWTGYRMALRDQPEPED